MRGRVWGNNHCSQTTAPKSRRTDNHTEGTLGYVLIRDAHLVDTAYIRWRVELCDLEGGREAERKGGMEMETDLTQSKYSLLKK